MYYCEGHLKFYKLLVLSEVSDPSIYSLSEIIIIPRHIIIPAATNWFHRLFFQLRNKQEMMWPAGTKSILENSPPSRAKKQNSRWTVYVTISRLFLRKVDPRVRYPTPSLALMLLFAPNHKYKAPVLHGDSPMAPAPLCAKTAFRRGQPHLQLIYTSWALSCHLPQPCKKERAAQNCVGN